MSAMFVLDSSQDLGISKKKLKPVLNFEQANSLGQGIA
jgi:hypothetical protein